MLRLSADQVRAVARWFTPERPGPLIWAHGVRSGHGEVRVDRWPDPRIVLAEVPGNYALRGDPDRLDPDDLRDVAGFVEAPPQWLPALRRADPGVAQWSRVVATMPPEVEVPGPRPDVRALHASDAAAPAGLAPQLSWIHSPWGGPAELAATGSAHGGFADGRLVAVAVPFYVGDRHEGIGVVTDPAHRRQGLSTACAAALVADIRGRGHLPTWTTSPDNTASLAVAAHLEFQPVRDDVLYALRNPIPIA